MDMGSSRGSSSADLGENAVEDDAPGDAVIPEEAGHPLSCEEAQLGWCHRPGRRKGACGGR